MKRETIGNIQMVVNPHHAHPALAFLQRHAARRASPLPRNASRPTDMAGRAAASRPPLSLCQTTAFLKGWPSRSIRVGNNSKLPVDVFFLQSRDGVDMYTDGWRYFSLLPCDPTTAPAPEDETLLCLIFKSNVKDNAHFAVTSLDGLRWSAKGIVVMPPHLYLNDSRWSLKHNLALLRHGGAMLAAGGTGRTDGGGGTSIARTTKSFASLPRFARSPSRAYDSASDWALALAASRHFGAASHHFWAEARPLVNSSHPGCVENRTDVSFGMGSSKQLIIEASRTGWKTGQCRYDGRLSLAHHNGRFWLYARANVFQGGRAVQVTSSADGVTWAPFKLISVADYNPFDRTDPKSEPNMYFFAVEKNPVAQDSLIALFPLIHNRSACVAMSCSRDGVHFSRPTPLLRCMPDTRHATPLYHPVAGLVKRRESIWFYVHRYVPNLKFGPEAIKSFCSKGLRLRECSNSSNYQGVRAFDEALSPRITRHDVPAAALMAWTVANGCASNSTAL